MTAIRGPLARIPDYPAYKLETMVEATEPDKYLVRLTFKIDAEFVYDSPGLAHIIDRNHMTERALRGPDRFPRY